jgi:hypothetical protein
MWVLLSVFPFVIYKLTICCLHVLRNLIWLIEEVIKGEKWFDLLLVEAESKILCPVNLSFQEGGIHVCWLMLHLTFVMSQSDLVIDF